jgi:hypothetical protein
MRFHDVTSLVNESAPDYAKPVIPLREYSQRRSGTLRAPREFLSTTSKPLAVVGMTSRLEEPSGSGRCIGSCDGRTTCPLYRLRRAGIRFSIKVNSLFTGELSKCP